MDDQAVSFLRPNIFSPNLISRYVITTITTAAIISGITRDKTEVPIAAAFSPVATTAFPVPAVSFVDASLVRAVPPCMVAADPPPKINPVNHFSRSLSKGRTDVRRSVPAPTASGVVIVSSRIYHL